jgi:hydroxymethylpyrimidine/phosphomethylpyrimidine kinase
MTATDETTAPVVALTIAGSDSGGGAGVQADLKTFAAHGVFGTSAFTALTAQNTVGVQGVHAVPVEFVDAQITSVLDDFEVAVVKTGMLATAPIVELIGARARAGELPNLVVDPVMVAAGGDRLLDREAERRYLSDLFPYALVVTPNLREAGVLVGEELRTLDDMRTAACRLGETGARAVIVKGGHLEDDEAVDVLWDGSDLVELHAERVDTANVHGTGCTFASAVAAGLACGSDVGEAAERAKRYVTRALRAGSGWKLGKGHGPVQHFA